MSTTLTRVRFQTVGCRLNQYETERMAASLDRYGFERVDDGEPAELYIINTCTVTHRADRDCRYLVRRARRENPDARIVLVGCYVETDPERIATELGVDAVILNSEKDTIDKILAGRWPEMFTDEGESESALSNFHQRNRAWVKVSDGCNQNCSYCLVTIVRGDLVCRSAPSIIEDIKRLVEHGYREIVLTGVNVGYYEDHGSSPSLASFTDLCRLILAETDLHRLRISSIEPQSVTDDLLELYAEAGGRICRHWHMPLQSGSDRILKLMHRPYTHDRYLIQAERIKKTVAGGIVGADVIVGFPGESDEDFQASCRVADSGLVDYLHVFSYSDRPGTEAALLSGKVAPKLIGERVQQLREISQHRWRLAHENQIGQVLEVISENKIADAGCFRAVGDNYLKVRLPVGFASGRAVVRVRPTVAHDDFADCELLDS
jgi:threonylcarbamoyladenosine tRNA methylthiotransferase MtaB